MNLTLTEIELILAVLQTVKAPPKRLNVLIKKLEDEADRLYQKIAGKPMHD